MANHKASLGVLKCGSDIIGEVRSYTITEEAATIDDTNLGDAARTFQAGAESWNASCDVFWDESNTGQTLMTVSSSVTLSVMMEGADSGDTYLTGTAIVTNKTISGAIDGIVEATFTLQGTGALSQTAV